MDKPNSQIDMCARILAILGIAITLMQFCFSMWSDRAANQSQLMAWDASVESGDAAMAVGINESIHLREFRTLTISNIGRRDTSITKIREADTLWGDVQLTTPAGEAIDYPIHLPRGTSVILRLSFVIYVPEEHQKEVRFAWSLRELKAADGTSGLAFTDDVPLNAGDGIPEFTWRHDFQTVRSKVPPPDFKLEMVESGGKRTYVNFRKGRTATRD